MALYQVGSVSVDDAGVVTKSGIAAEYYDAIYAAESATFPDPSTPSADFTGTAESWKTRVEAILINVQKGFARQANALATAVGRSRDYLTLAPMAAAMGMVAAAGSFTIGGTFLTGAPVKCLGIRFHWVVASQKTVRATLWSPGPVALASLDTDVASTGVYEALFATPVDLAAFTQYIYGLWQTDGAQYMSTLNSNGNFLPARPYYAGANTVIQSIIRFAAGNAAPSGNAVNEIYPFDPIIAVGA